MKVIPNVRLENILKLTLTISRIAREIRVSLSLIYDAMKRYSINCSKYTNLEQYVQPSTKGWYDQNTSSKLWLDNGAKTIW